MNERFQPSDPDTQELIGVDFTEKRVIGRKTIDIVNSKDLGGENMSIKRENGLTYAQDQSEMSGYVASAEQIIDALIAGDESAVGHLPQEFADALRVRVKSYEGQISAEERDAMISVACNALATANGDEKALAA